MEYSDIVQLIDTDPVVQTLLELPLAMRLAYLGLDGHPRAVPITIVWDGKAFVFATPASTYKVKAIAANPKVGFTLDIGPGRTAAEARARVTAALGPPIAHYVPMGIVGRGTASIEIEQGLSQVHIDASRRMINDDKTWQAWARSESEHQTEMAVISIIPTYVRVHDFINRFPPPAKMNALAYLGDKSPSENSAG